MFRRILVPLDGSTRAERAIPVAARIARASHGSVIVARVVNAPIESCYYLGTQLALTETIVDDDLLEADRYLSAIGTTTALQGVPIEKIALFGPTAPTLLTIVRTYQADLVVMCSHGYTGMTRWVLGSVAEKMARHSTVPVLVLREAGSVPASPHPDMTRPLRILVPLDGSAYAKAALEPAASLIAALSAPAAGALHLTRVVKLLTSDDEENRRQEELHEREHVLSKARNYLHSTEGHLREGLLAPAVADLKIPVTWSVALDTDIAGAIIRVAENGEDAEGAGVFGGCDVIAMATHGRSGLHHWAMGSITERVLTATKLPLLIVRPSGMMDKGHVTWDKATLSAIQA